VSWEVVNLVNSRQYRKPARRLLHMLAHHAAPNGERIFPSIPTLAQEVGVCVRTVQRNLKSLIADGLLERVGERPCSNGYTQIWRLDLDALRALSPIKQDDDRRQNAIQQVTGCHPSPDRMSPDPRQDVTQSCHGIVDDDDVAPAREPESDLNALEASCRQWANGSLNLTAPGARDISLILRLLKPPTGAEPCTLDDVRNGIAIAAESLHRRGQLASSLAYFHQPILQARDSRLTSHSKMEIAYERSRQGAGRAAHNGEGGAGGRPRQQHGGDGLLAAAARIRARQESR